MEHSILTHRRPTHLRLLIAVVALVMSANASHVFADDLPSVAGIVKPYRDVMLSTSVPGIIMTHRLKEGDFVKEGQTIIDLDKHLEELEVERRKLQVDIHRSDFEGTATLFKTTKGTSKEEMDKKESDYKLAVVEHSMALEQLHRRELISPLAGTIVELKLETGESCQPYQPLARVVDARQCYFIANVEAVAAATLKTNQTVSLEIDAGAATEPVTGTVSFLSPVADAASGLIKLKVLFDNPSGKIRPGLAGRLLLK